MADIPVAVNDLIGELRKSAMQSSFEDMAKVARKLNFIGFQEGRTEFRLLVNDEELLAKMLATTGELVMLKAMLDAAKSEFEPHYKPILEDVIIEAAAGLPEKSWPKIYTDHVIFRMYKSLPDPRIIIEQAHQITLDFPDLSDHLGDDEDFSVAYHHGAILAGSSWENPERADVRRGPVDESELKVSSAGRRFRYLKALRNRNKTLTIYETDDGDEERYDDEDNVIKFKKKRIQLAGGDWTWKKTIDARIIAWDNIQKAPEWLLLEHGQPKWEPTFTGKFQAFGAGGQLNPGNITFAWLNRLEEIWTKAILGAFAAQFEKANRITVSTPTRQNASNIRSETYVRGKKGAIQTSYRDLTSGRFIAYTGE